MNIQEKVSKYLKKYYEGQVEEAKTQQLEPLFTDKNEAKRFIEHMEENIEAPYVKGKMSTLGGSITVFIDVSLQKKEEWKNGIFQNSPHFTMRVEPDPSKNNLDQPQQSHEMKKFRKQKAKTSKEAVSKINKYIEGVK